MTQYRKAEKQELVSVSDRMKQLEDERDALQAKCDAKGVLIDELTELVDTYTASAVKEALIEPEAKRRLFLKAVAVSFQKLQYEFDVVLEGGS